MQYTIIPQIFKLSRGFLNFFLVEDGGIEPHSLCLLYAVRQANHLSVYLLGLPWCPTSSPIGWLVYPAYPRHCFSLRGLVHICIPHTGTPCGRIIGWKVLPTLVGLSLWDCLALPFCAFIIAHLYSVVKGFWKIIFASLGWVSYCLCPHLELDRRD